jgi:formate dehydrogenase subunit gamma
MTPQIHNIIARLREQPGPLLLVLHAIQHELGHIPPEAVPAIAAGLNLSRAEVHGVITFYHHFRQAPAGRHTVQLCRAEACQAMQADRLATHVQQQLAVGFDETTADGQFSLKPVYCLGNCACAPAMMIDDHLYGRVSTARFDELLALWRQEP